MRLSLSLSRAVRVRLGVWAPSPSPGPGHHLLEGQRAFRQHSEDLVVYVNLWQTKLLLLFIYSIHRNWEIESYMVDDLTFKHVGLW